MRELVIGNLTAKLPIVQGGMGIGVSMESLVSAVANEGGIGTLSAAGLGIDLPGYVKEPIETARQALRDLIHKTREKTTGIVGINIMVALTNYELFVQTAIEEKIDIIFSGAGLPVDLPEYLKADSVTKLVPIVSSVKAAALLAKRWKSKYDYLPDAFVVEGPMAGGHLGFKVEQLCDEAYQLEEIVKEVVAFTKEVEAEHGKHIPVIAAGGIFTGQDIKKFMDLGADGVQMATRFVATKECDASEAFKNSYVNCKKEDLTIIKSPVGMPGRAIQNAFLQDAKQGITKPIRCPFHCIKTCNVTDSPYCIASALLHAKNGKLEHGFAFAGANAYRVDKIDTVSNLMHSLQEEYEQACVLEAGGE